KTVATTGFDQAGRERGVRLWEMATGNLRGKLLEGAAPFHATAMAFSPDGKTLCTLIRQKEQLASVACVWDLGIRKSICFLNLPDDSSWVKSKRYSGFDLLMFSPDGKALVTALSQGGLRGLHRQAWLWDAATGKLIRQLETGSVRDITYSPDGQYLLVGSSVREARTWDDQLQSGRGPGEACVFSAVTGYPLCKPILGAMGRVQCHQSSELFLTSGTEEVRLWHAPSGKPFGLPLSQPPQLTFPRADIYRHVQFSPDGNYLLTFSDANVRVRRIALPY